MADAPFVPSWKEFEEKANNASTAKEQLAASDAFEEARAKEMRHSRKARDWENSRKASIAKEKPKWAKQQRKEEAEQVLKELSKFKNAGVFEYDVKPMPGYVLVKVEVLQQTESGLVMPDVEEPNTGVIVEASDDIVTNIGDSQAILKCPVKKGDRVMFKRYAGAGVAGLEIRSKDQDYRLMRWSYDNNTNDLLATLV